MTSNLSRLILRAAISSLITFGASWAAPAPETPKVDEILVRYKEDAANAPSQSLSAAQRAIDTGARLGETFTYMRSTKNGAHIMRAGRKMTRAEAWELASRIVQQGDVAYAQPIDPEFHLRPPAKLPVKAGASARP